MHPTGHARREVKMAGPSSDDAGWYLNGERCSCGGHTVWHGLRVRARDGGALQRRVYGGWRVRIAVLHRVGRYWWLVFGIVHGGELYANEVVHEEDGAIEY